ncbi:MAG: ABC transporter ATP-binding protein, partial [Phycisphaerales bacterium]
MADVLLTKVSKVYPGGVKAVDAIDLAIADGSFVVLVGPSGCGKSTTLRMIAGLEEISSGTISIGGRVVNDIPARDRDIAMVFQSYALYPHLSVRQNLEFPLLRRRRHASLLRSLVSPSYAQARRAEIAAMADRVEKAAKTLEITALLARKPKELSGGQRQRVALGRALVRDPAVFLLDEPLSNLDARLRLEMRAELRMLHRRTGGTMVHVTHDQEEAMTLGDRLVVMKDGVIRQEGSPIEIYEEPADAFVAGFIGTPAMNLVEGEVTLGDGAARFHAGAASAPAFSIDLPPALAEVAAKHARGERSLRVTLGVRPDAVR